MIKFASLSSGSSGNSVFIEYDGIKILVDAGFSGKIEKNLLEKIGVDINDIDALFLTHEHTDHVKGAGIISRRYNIPIFANKGTRLGFSEVSGKIKDENINIFKSNNFLRFKNMDIYPFSIYHDSREPVGFDFYLGNKKITLLTDTGNVDYDIVNEIKGSSIYYFESNHDLNALKSGPYTYNAKKRIMSDIGHLSNNQAGEILADVLKGDGEYVFLAHLSSINNSSELSYLTVSDILKSYGIDSEKQISLSVCPRYTPGDVITL